MTSLNLGRLIVEVVGKEPRPRRAVIEPGASLEVGRTERAGLVIASDPELSGVHCRIAWERGQIGVIDLASASGTHLNGERVEEAIAKHRGWLRVGATNLRLYVEGFSGLENPVADPPLDRVKAQVLNALVREPGRLYAIVDATHVRARELLCESIDPRVSLYDGIEGARLSDVAPYLVEIQSDSALLERLVRCGWGQKWGIFFVCARNMMDLRRHLRRFLTVEDAETGKRFYFRFYDPSALETFLPTCTRLQRGEFFGPIERFLFEGHDGGVVREAVDGPSREAP